MQNELIDTDKDLDIEKLKRVCYNIDDFLVSLVSKEKMDILSFSGLVLGRMVLMSKTAGCEEEFLGLCQHLGNKLETKTEEMPPDNSKLH